MALNLHYVRSLDSVPTVFTWLVDPKIDTESLIAIDPHQMLYRAAFNSISRLTGFGWSLWYFSSMVPLTWLESLTVIFQVIGARRSRLCDSSMTELVVTCLTLVGHLLYQCHVCHARFIQLKGVELMVELSGAECQSAGCQDTPVIYWHWFL